MTARASLMPSDAVVTLLIVAVWRRVRLRRRQQQQLQHRHWYDASYWPIINHQPVATDTARDTVAIIYRLLRPTKYSTLGSCYNARPKVLYYRKARYWFCFVVDTPTGVSKPKRVVTWRRYISDARHVIFMLPLCFSLYYVIHLNCLCSRIDDRSRS